MTFKNLIISYGERMLIIFFLLFIFSNFQAHAQGLNRTFLLGYLQTLLDTNMTSPKARLLIDPINFQLLPEIRKMPFRGAQATISDDNGNLIIATNGCWIANSTNDTMQNGGGLNPGNFTDDWCDALSAIPFAHANVVLPYPGDSTKYILFHQTGNYSVGVMATEIYQTIIDMTLDGGLGGVIQKNIIVFSDTLVPGMAACRHANGRDWWLIALEDNSTRIYKFLITPFGSSFYGMQSFNALPPAFNNVAQPTFSPDGTKLAYTFTDYTNWSNPYHDIRLFNFDRCSGILSSPTLIDVSDGFGGLGVAFSPNSKYLYACSWQNIYQINTDTNNIPASVQLVAANDGYYSPFPPFQTDFWTMYLAANGKIYISSGNGVLDIHYMNFPDSAGVASGVQQHALHLPCYSSRGNVYHPNYYLGAADGTICDSLGLNPVNDLLLIEKSFTVNPNPNNGNFSISYLLPQNKDGEFELYDLKGNKVFAMQLPPWSTFQSIEITNLVGGIYQGVINSDGMRVVKKVVIVN